MKASTHKPPTTLEELRTHATTDIPTAGRIAFGLSRSGSYRAAEGGFIPTIKIGDRRAVVPVPRLLAMLEGEVTAA